MVCPADSVPLYMLRGTKPPAMSLWSCQGTDAVPGVARVRKVLRESLVVCGGSGQAASSSRMVRRL